MRVITGEADDARSVSVYLVDDARIAVQASASLVQAGSDAGDTSLMEVPEAAF